MNIAGKRQKSFRITIKGSKLTFSVENSVGVSFANTHSMEGLQFSLSLAIRAEI